MQGNGVQDIARGPVQRHGFGKARDEIDFCGRENLRQFTDGTTAFDYRTTIIARVPRFVLVKTKPAGGAGGTDAEDMRRFLYAKVARTSGPVEGSDGITMPRTSTCGKSLIAR
jgi:hypothetical protein